MIDFSALPKKGAIGVFDSGYGGLSILKELRKHLPQYDYIYLGDNARAPYGNRSFDVVYRYTREAVEFLFGQGCPLVIVACNTASAKALRTIQMNDLPRWDASRRVLGIIRPTTEIIGSITRTRHVGLFATAGTVASHSYEMEIAKFHPDVTVTSLACPMWVPLVENREYLSEGAHYFVKKYIDEILQLDSQIDTLILGCTHYPLLMPVIEKYVPKHVRVLAQGERVAESLTDYLERHSDLQARLTAQQCCRYLTTEHAEAFTSLGSLFMEDSIKAQHIELDD